MIIIKSKVSNEKYCISLILMEINSTITLVFTSTNYLANINVIDNYFKYNKINTLTTCFEIIEYVHNK